MRKYFCIAFCVILALAGLSIQAMAASLDDVAGDYNVEIQAKFKVKKLGSDKTFTPGVLTLNAGGTFFLDDFGTANDVDGSISLDSKGKKIFYQLSAAGTAALKASLTNWLENAAADEGVDITGVNFTFLEVKPSKVKIDKKTNRAKGKAKLKVKGTVSGTVDGSFEQSNFSYQAKIVILP